MALTGVTMDPESVVDRSLGSSEAASFAEGSRARVASLAQRTGTALKGQASLQMLGTLVKGAGGLRI